MASARVLGDTCNELVDGIHWASVAAGSRPRTQDLRRSRSLPSGTSVTPGAWPVPSELSRMKLAYAGCSGGCHFVSSRPASNSLRATLAVNPWSPSPAETISSGCRTRSGSQSFEPRHRARPTASRSEVRPSCRGGDGRSQRRPPRGVSSIDGSEAGVNRTGAGSQSWSRTSLTTGTPPWANW